MQIEARDVWRLYTDNLTQEVCRLRINTAAVVSLVLILMATGAVAQQVENTWIGNTGSGSPIRVAPATIMISSRFVLSKRRMNLRMLS